MTAKFEIGDIVRIVGHEAYADIEFIIRWINPNDEYPYELCPMQSGVQVQMVPLCIYAKEIAIEKIEKIEDKMTPKFKVGDWVKDISYLGNRRAIYRIRQTVETEDGEDYRVAAHHWIQEKFLEAIVPKGYQGAVVSIKDSDKFWILLEHDTMCWFGQNTDEEYGAIYDEDILEVMDGPLP
jgi:hypothetical protein